VNVDVKGFTDDFYHRVCSGEAGPVLETLEYLTSETGVRVEITNLLIPGTNDSDTEIPRDDPVGDREPPAGRAGALHHHSRPHLAQEKSSTPHSGPATIKLVNLSSLTRIMTNFG
jgi:hypothetical protein